MLSRGGELFFFQVSWCLRFWPFTFRELSWLMNDIGCILVMFSVKSAYFMAVANAFGEFEDDSRGHIWKKIWGSNLPL